MVKGILIKDVFFHCEVDFIMNGYGDLSEAFLWLLGGLCYFTPIYNNLLM